MPQYAEKPAHPFAGLPEIRHWHFFWLVNILILLNKCWDPGGTRIAFSQPKPLEEKTMRSKGYTIVELMIVVGLIGILAVMAISSLPFLASDVRSQRTRNMFAATLREARGRALANRSYVAVEITSGANQLIRMCEKKCMFDSSSSSDTNRCLNAGGCEMGSEGWTGVKQVALKSTDTNSEYFNVTITAMPVASPALIIYNPRGRMESTAPAGVYRFTAGKDSSRQSSVILRATGVAEVQ